jgi:hypothetical protein
VARRRGLAVAIALAAHVVLLTDLLWRFETWPAEYSTPVMAVDLVRLPRARAPKPPGFAVAARTRAELAPIQPHVTPTLPPVATAPPSAQVAGDVQHALRGLVGCNHAGFLGLTDAERQRCQDRLARAGGGDPRSAQIELDLARRAAAAKGPEREPFLARIPHNGCAPRVKETEEGTAGVARQDWTAGIACAWSF